MEKDDYDLDATIVSIGQDQETTEDGTSLFEVGWRLIESFPTSQELSRLEEGIALTREGLAETSSSSLEYATAIDNLAYGLKLKYDHLGQIQDLNESVCFQRRTVELFIPPDPKYFDCLEHLAIALQRRFHRLGKPEDLNEAISLHKQAIEEFPHHPNRVTALSNLGNALKERFEQEGDLSDLTESIAVQRHALDAIPSTDSRKRFAILNNLANALHRRFEHKGDAEDINKATLLHREALGLLSTEDPNRPTSINNLAYALTTRYEQQGRLEDLEEAILLHRQALSLLPPLHPNRSGSLNNIANALISRFEQGGDPKDLDEAVVFNREALELRQSPHPKQAQSLSDLGHALQKRHEYQGKQEDLDESISLHQQALELYSRSHPYRSNALNNLANALRSRFQIRGDFKDLDETISLQRQALELVPPSHTNHSQSLNNLAIALVSRFQYRGDPTDLDESISLHKEALQYRPSPHPNRVDSLNNLARALETRYWRGDREDDRDLNEAIFLHRQTLELLPLQHPDRSICLNNLASALMARSQRQDRLEDLDEAVSLCRQALDLRPPPDPDRSTSLNNLANALGERFKKSRDTKDLFDAIDLGRQSLDLLPVTHRNRPAILQNCGLLEIFAHELAGNAHESHLNQALSFFSEAVKSFSVSPTSRFQIAELWSQYADQYGHPSVLEAFDIALGVLPELAALNLNLQSRRNALTTRTDGIARKAASCAIRLGKLDKAVEYLETGRGIFWTQFLHLRSPFDKVRDVAPELESNLRRISEALDQGSHRDIPGGMLTNLQKLSLEDEARRFEHLAIEWSETVDKIRHINGFQDFLRPNKFETLQSAAKEYPVVYLVANEDGSDCLIMTSTAVRHIPLDDLTTLKLSKLVGLTQIAASEYEMPRSHIPSLKSEEAAVDPNTVIGEIKRWMVEEERGMRLEKTSLSKLASDDIFKVVLAYLWVKVVKPILDLLNIQRSENRQVVKWCPSGLFTFLPIHAAGRYDGEDGECAADYIISSYTPTIGVLLGQETQPSNDRFKMIVVVQSRTLPATLRELEKIQSRVPAKALVKFGLPRTPISVDDIATNLQTASIVHFACHGTQDATNPLNSGLEIENERLTIARIMKESVPNGSLAFLSACETAVGDENIPDEALNIGASLLFCGFRSVIATMWKMWDADGPVIADAFYREIFKESTENPVLYPDTSKSAQALHLAVQELRSRGVPFRRWIPFIHMGK